MKNDINENIHILTQEIKNSEETLKREQKNLALKMLNGLGDDIKETLNNVNNVETNHTQINENKFKKFLKKLLNTCNF